MTQANKITKYCLNFLLSPSPTPVFPLELVEMNSARASTGTVKKPSDTEYHNTAKGDEDSIVVGNCAHNTKDCNQGGTPQKSGRRP
jgi:hypothetical protein